MAVVVEAEKLVTDHLQIEGRADEIEVLTVVG